MNIKCLLQKKWAARAVLLILLLSAVGMTNLMAQPTGAINGLFSVSENTQVYFSQGNLQYIGSAPVPYWKFAENQWDYLGDNGQGSDSQTVDRDLFGWGTSGYDHGAVCYQPWSTSQNNDDYYAYGSANYNLYDQTGQADWGLNPISNGDNEENSSWRTLTTQEWNYVFNSRTTPSGIRYAKAQVNDINGTILLPDNWDNSIFSLNNANSGAAFYNSNEITASQWTTLENAGAVFLPAAGYRVNTIAETGIYGQYWSASYYSANSELAYDMHFYCHDYSANLYPSGATTRHTGCSVRLVKDAQSETGSIIEIGVGGTATNQYLPSYSYYCHTLSQQIYTAEEIGTSGTITSVAFYNGGAEKTRTYDLYLVHTDKDSFYDNYDWIAASEADRVFSGTMTMLSDQWNTFAFDTPFVYDGTSNLALIVDDNTGSWTNSPHMACRVFGTDAVQAIRVYNDGTNYDPYNPSGYNGTLYYEKNQLVLELLDGNSRFIRAIADPSTAGMVTGGGVYALDETCTLTAIPNPGCTFINWTENGEVVSVEPEFSFTVTENRALVAHFQYPTTLTDDFNDGEINPELWTYAGSSVYEDEGLMKLEQNNTDENVYLLSAPLALASDNQIVIDRKFYLHRAYDYYYGEQTVFLNGDENTYVRVQYFYDSYDGRYGTYLVSQFYGEYYETYLCDAQFDTWLTEKVIIDFADGTLAYYLDGNLVSTSYVPYLAEQEVNYYNLKFRPYGWWTGHYQYMDYIAVNPEPTTLVANPDPIDLGHRPSGAWMRPYSVSIGNQGMTTSINSLAFSNNFFVLDETPALPINLGYGESFGFDVSTTMGNGVINANLLVGYGDGEQAQFPVTATAYIPAVGDVWENPIVLNSFPYTATLNSANYPLYDNYVLPPASVADGADVVYKLVFNEDTYLNANVTEGDNGKVALYREGFQGLGGPDLENNYKGPEMAIEEWLHYDNGEWYTSWCSGTGVFDWGILFTPDQLVNYPDSKLTKVTFYDTEYSIGTHIINIYQGGDTPSNGTLLHSQSFEATSDYTWHEVNLDAVIPVDVTQNLWITMHYDGDDGYPASACLDQGEPNGRWYSSDNGASWGDHGYSYDTWMLRGLVTNASGREMVLGDRNETIDVTIGEGTSTTGYFPFYTLYNYSIAENLFLASELEEAGMTKGEISSLSWYATNAPGYYQQGISIWMANVEDSELTTTSHTVDDMTLVYTGGMTPEIGWNTFEFNEGNFTWDGTSNILIFCQRNNGEWNSTVQWQAHNPGFPAMSYKYQDSGAYDVTVTNTMNVSSTARPNIRFTYEPGNNGIANMTVTPGTYYLVASSTSNEWIVEINAGEVPCPDMAYNPSPANGATEITPNNVSLQWTLGNRTTEYKLCFGTNPNNMETLVDWTRDLSNHYTISGLHNNTIYYWRVDQRNDGCPESVEGELWSFTTHLNVPGYLWANSDQIFEGDWDALYWEAPTERGLLSYNVYCYDGMTGSTILIGSTTDTYYEINNLPYNMNGYRFNVTAVYDEGESYYSNDVWVYVSGYGTVEGNVYEQDGITPIEGATVTFNGYNDFGWYSTFQFPTDANGHYRGTLYVGDYSVQASCSGYQSKNYGQNVYVSYNENLSGIDFNLDERFNPVSEVLAEYYPDANDPNSPYVKVIWSNNTSGWHTYLESEFDNAYCSYNGNPSWGYEYPVEVISQYAGYNLNKVALFSDNMYNAVGGNFTCNVYMGGSIPGEGALVSTITVDVPVGLGEWVEYSLTNPVHVTGTEPLWVIWHANTIGGEGYPAGCASHYSSYGDWWDNGQNSWSHMGSCTWTMKNYFSNLGGHSVSLTYNSNMVSNANGNQQGHNSNHSGISAKAINPNPERIPFKVTENDRSFQYYRVYRTDEYNDGPFTEANTVVIAEATTDTLLIDMSWSSLEMGSYKYGVSCVYEGNRESAISWGGKKQESARRGSVLQHTPIFPLDENGNGPDPLSQTNTNENPPMLRTEISECYVARWHHGNDFARFILNNPAEGYSLGFTNDVFTNGACYMNETLYFSDIDGKFGIIDPETGLNIITTGCPFNVIEYNPVDGKMYGCNSSGYLYEVNPEDGSYVELAYMPVSALITFTITNEGRFIICDRGDETIKEYNLETGELTTLIYMDWDINYGQDMATDRETNEVYWAAVNNSASSGRYPLIKVDLVNYTINTIGYFDGQVSAFVITDKHFVQLPRESQIVWSNPMAKDLLLTNGAVNVTVTLNSGDSPEGTVVSFNNLNQNEQTHHPVADVVLDGSGYYAWDMFRKGEYEVTISKEGYETVTEYVSIYESTALQYQLEEIMTEISDLYVSRTGWATWSGPYDNGFIIPSSGDSFEFGFEASLEGWTVLTVNTEGGYWLHSSNNPGGYDYTTHAHGGTGFALCYSYIDYSGAFNTDSYLVSPQQYRISSGSTLTFWADNANDNYPENFSVCIATVDNPTASDFIEVWNGSAKSNSNTKAEVRHETNRYDNWRWHSINLSAYAGQKVWIAIHDVNYDMYEIWIDDMVLSTNAKGGRHLEAVQVMLSDMSGNILYTGETENDYLQLPVESLVEGQTYHLAVGSVYSSGLSNWEEVDWVYEPCDNYEGATDLLGQTVDEGVMLSWTYPEIDRSSTQTRGAKAYACLNNSTWINYDLSNPYNTTDLNSISLFGGDYCSRDGYVYATYYYNWYKIEPLTGNIVEQGSFGLYGFYDCAWDKTTNTMYGLNDTELYSWNLETNELQYIGYMGTSFEVLACDRNGQLYGVAVGYPANLYKINKYNASIEWVGSIGYNCDYYWQSGAIDPATGKLYWACYLGDGGSLIEVDLQTGAGTLLYSEVGQQTCFCFPSAFNPDFDIAAMIFRDGEYLGITTDDTFLDEGGSKDHEYSLRVVYGGEANCPDENFYFSMSCPQTFEVYGPIVTQTTQFVEGWTWWSTYLNQEHVDGLGLLKDGLDDKGVVIKSQTQTLTYMSGRWFGPMTELENKLGYMVKVSENCTVSMTGEVADPEEHPVSLNTGWTWVGYPTNQALPISVALANLEPVDGDFLKSQTSSAIYYDALGWIGSLKTLTPGVGLMYKSNNEETVTFSYNTEAKAVETEPNLTAEGNLWEPVVQAYPYNMSVMAVVEVNDEELQSERYELAAFANGVCRGSTKLMYVEPLNRYMAFLTVYGEEAAELNFGLYDAETGMTTFESSERLDFIANAIVGDPMEPYVVSFRGTTGIDEQSIDVNVYPNPVDKGSTFSIDLPANGSKVQIDIINALGVVVESVSTSAVQTMKAPEAAGVYTLRITVDGNKTHIRKLIVR